MKLSKKVIIINLVIGTFCLTSCVFGNGHRTNNIVPGYYVGVDQNDDNKQASLTISPITKNEYDEANGTNIIKDLVKTGYYKLEFYIRKDGKEPELLKFTNFVDEFNGAKDRPISYIDDNGVVLSPQPAAENQYYVIYRKIENKFDFYIHLHEAENNKNE